MTKSAAQGWRGFAGQGAKQARRKNTRRQYVAGLRPRDVVLSSVRYEVGLRHLSLRTYFVAFRGKRKSRSILLLIQI